MVSSYKGRANLLFLRVCQLLLWDLRLFYEKSPIHFAMSSILSSASAPSARHVGVIATSLNPLSRSQILANHVFERLQKRDVQSTLLDLRLHPPLPLAGSEASWSNEAVHRLRTIVSSMTHLIFAVPIYNYDVNSTAKVFIELMGENLGGGKTVGFVCTAGAQGSYMSIMPFANSLMLDFRCWIVPRFVYAMGELSTAGLSKDLDSRIDNLIDDLLSR